MSGQYKVEIKNKEFLCSDIVRLSLYAPQVAKPAQAGQFVMLKAGNDSGVLLRRPFSIHKCDKDKGVIELLIKLVGKGTRLISSLKPGEMVDVLGPLGKGFNLTQTVRVGREQETPLTSANDYPLPDTQPPLNEPVQLEKRLQPVCIIGGGIGIAPLFFLAAELSKKTNRNKVTILLGSRGADEISQLNKEFSDLGYTPILATEDGSLGHQGRVPELLNLLADEDWQVFACGPQAMLKAIAEICSARSWACHVSMETMMACGISACLGCGVKRKDSHGGAYLHSCKDGPVLDAAAIDWDSEV